MDHDNIDTLLERYLSLLDEYTRLRTRLSALQSDVFHGLARANFSAERGLRYGRDQYDERMQASRTLRIEAPEGGMALRFSVSRTGAGDDSVQEDREKKKKKNTDTEEEKEEDAPSTDDKPAPSETNTKQDTKGAKPDDPLRWFGLLTPQPLRTAQTKSIEAVEHVIPRMVSVSTEMVNLEIQVQRARKKRAKAAEKKAKAAAAGEANGSDQVTATGVKAS